MSEDLSHLFPESPFSAELQLMGRYSLDQVTDIIKPLQAERALQRTLQVNRQSQPGLCRSFIEQAGCLALAQGFSMIFFILFKEEDGLQGNAVLHIPAAAGTAEHEGGPGGPGMGMVISFAVLDNQGTVIAE